MAGDTGVAEIVTVVAALDTWSNVAVTVVLPPFSLIEAGDSNSVAVTMPQTLNSGVIVTAELLTIAAGRQAIELPPNRTESA